MSNPFKAVGKIFKTVAKVAISPARAILGKKLFKKILLPALMVGAVVLTGGAAIGALPAMGSMLASVGISGTMASVLGGAISMGAVGAVTGGLTAAIGGGNILKGATGGFLMGAATGGVMGGLGMVGANGILGGMGIGPKASLEAGLLAQGKGIPATAAMVTGPGGLSPAAANALQPMGIPAHASWTVPRAAGQPLVGAGQAGQSTVGAAGAMGGRTSLLGTLAPELLKVGGQVLTGFSQGKMTEAQLKAQQRAERDEYDRIAYNYGYRNIYDSKKSNVPCRQEQWYNYAPQDYTQPANSLLQLAQLPNPTPRMFQIVNGQVVMTGG